MKVVVNVFLKDGVLDPQGKAVHHALGTLHYDGVKEVRIGKQIVLDIDENDETKALEMVTQMCETVLANTVVENYTIEMDK
jgi:phosphoribosylformylglycinamidine synthase subunit PurS